MTGDIQLKHPNTIEFNIFSDDPHCPYCGAWAGVGTSHRQAKPCHHLIFYIEDGIGLDTWYFSSKMLNRIDKVGYNVHNRTDAYDDFPGHYYDEHGKRCSERTENSSYWGDVVYGDQDKNWYEFFNKIFKLTFGLCSICFHEESFDHSSQTWVFDMDDEENDTRDANEFGSWRDKKADSYENQSLLEMINEGENDEVEFKQTLSFDIKTKKKEVWIEEAIVKTIAAFLNSLGGTLLIGVDDQKEIIGIQHELENLYQGSEDKFLRQLNNLIKNKIGRPYFRLVKTSFVDIGGKRLLIISCKQSKVAVFIEKDFYIRSPAATQKLEGRDVVDYCKDRFISV